VTDKQHDLVTVPSHPHDAPDGTRSFASSSSFFSVKPKVVTEDVFFPEKDMWLRFKAITQAEWRQVQEFTYAYDPRSKQRVPENDKDMNIALFIAGAVDNDGSSVFDMRDYKRLLTEPYSVVNRGAEIVVRISGIGEDVMGKQRRKNLFGETGSDDES
jgi:hypothetical protein